MHVLHVTERTDRNGFQVKASANRAKLDYAILRTKVTELIACRVSLLAHPTFMLQAVSL